MSDDRPTVAVFRPDDERLAAAVATLEDAGAEPVADPMLAVEPTGATPADGADAVVLTSKTGVELVDEAGWEPALETTIAAIGAATADALEEAGYPVDLVPDAYSSSGLVDALAPRIEAGAIERVEVARSDHGSDVLLDGLSAAGATVHETVLYDLERPPASGESTALAAAGELDGAAFTSSLTVEHFLAAAADRELASAAVEGLEAAVVGAIGDPTAETAREHGIAVDVVSETADVEALLSAVLTTIDASSR